MFHFWNQNKAAVTAAMLATTKTVIENSYVFTSIPLAGQDHSDNIAKFFYMLSLVAVTAGLWSIVGMGVDHLRLEREDNNERSRLTI